MKNTLLLFALTFCILISAPIGNAQNVDSFLKDSVINFQVNFWKHNDTTQIKKIISELTRQEEVLMQNSKPEKDSSRLKSFRAVIDIHKSALANAKSGWKDSSLINDLKAKLIAKFQNQRVIAIKNGYMAVPKGMSEPQLNNLMRVRKNLQFEIKDSSPSAEIAGSNQEGADLSQLSLKKSFKGESLETVKKFSVTENSKMLKVDLVGKVESGSIMVTITKPDGSKFKSIEIDSSSDVNFEQTLSLKKSSADWIGDWQIKVKTRKANGDYRLNIVTR